MSSKWSGWIDLKTNSPCRRVASTKSVKDKLIKTQMKTEFSTEFCWHVCLATEKENIFIDITNYFFLQRNSPGNSQPLWAF